MVTDSRTYGQVFCSSLGESWASQECSPTSMYGFFEMCPVGCNSLCAIPEIDAVRIRPSTIQEFVPGYLHGIMSWFRFTGQAGQTYVIESHNEGKMYLYDAEMMSGESYMPNGAMLGGTENSQVVASSTPYQRIEWTCVASGEYAVLIAQSLWDCNNGCGVVDLSVTHMAAEDAGTQILELVPNAGSISVGVGCTEEDDAASLKVCHYREVRQEQDMRWLNGGGGRQFVMTLDGRAGQTFHFVTDIMSDQQIQEMVSQAWWEVEAMTRGDNIKVGEARPMRHLQYTGMNGITLRLTLYPPSAVGGARGWEDHTLTVGHLDGHVAGTSDSFSWTCPSAGTWFVVVEALCEMSMRNVKECSSGFRLAMTSADESTDTLTCTAPKGTEPEVCSGPTVEVTVEAPPAPVPPPLATKDSESPSAMDNNAEEQAELGRLFQIEQPPSLVFVRQVAPATAVATNAPSADQSTQRGEAFVDVTLEVRAANADVSQSVVSCLSEPGLLAQPGASPEGVAEFGRMFAPVHRCAHLSPITRLTPLNVEDAACSNSAELAEEEGELNRACCGASACEGSLPTSGCAPATGT